VYQINLDMCVNRTHRTNVLPACTICLVLSWLPGLLVHENVTKVIVTLVVIVRIFQHIFYIKYHKVQSIYYNFRLW